MLAIKTTSIDDAQAILGYGKQSAWIQLVSMADIAMQDIDRGRWFIGDVVNLIETAYGADSRGEFAKEIGVAKKTAYAWGRVSKTFPEISPHGVTYNRANLPENVSWSSCREVAALDHDTAWALLIDASLEGWTVDQLARKVRQSQTINARFSCEVTLDAVEYEHLVLFAKAALDGLQVGARYQLTLKRIEDGQS